MYLICLWLGKLLQRASRLAGNSGAALPGYVIERFYPQFLEKGLSRLPEGVVVVSGTNGKTTTTKVVSDVLASMGDRVLTNSTGSNMTRGLISTLVSKSRFSGRLPFDVAVLEVDEAYGALLAKRLPIRGAVILNVMRDQLDRFGEIDKTARLLGELSQAARDFVVLNAADNRVRELPAAAERLSFAPGRSVSKRFINDDDWHGAADGKTVRADYILSATQDNKLTISAAGRNFDIASKFHGAHNHLNLTAAVAVLNQIKPETDLSLIVKAAARVRPAFGRGEKIRLEKASIDLLLVKNPSSFVSTMAEANIAGYDHVAVVINDAYADSRDVSWLWDVDFKPLAQAKDIITGGRRGYDMAVRLKYEQMEVARTILGEAALLDAVQEGKWAIFCTYTAMLNLRRELVRRGHVEQVI